MCVVAQAAKWRSGTVGWSQTEGLCISIEECLEADQLVGPVVTLVQQNAIELDLRNVCRRTGCKVAFRNRWLESDRGTMHKYRGVP